jgi:hypothetical protein
MPIDKGIQPIKMNWDKHSVYLVGLLAPVLDVYLSMFLGIIQQNLFINKYRLHLVKVFFYLYSLSFFLKYVPFDFTKLNILKKIEYKK